MVGRASPFVQPVQQEHATLGTLYKACVPAGCVENLWIRRLETWVDVVHPWTQAVHRVDCSVHKCSGGVSFSELPLCDRRDGKDSLAVHADLVEPIGEYHQARNQIPG